jgi:hypothetical protein
MDIPVFSGTHADLLVIVSHLRVWLFKSTLLYTW